MISGRVTLRSIERIERRHGIAAGKGEPQNPATTTRGKYPLLRRKTHSRKTMLRKPPKFLNTSPELTYVEACFSSSPRSRGSKG